MYRTVLVCLDSRERAGAILRTALAIAEAQGAHLIGLHVVQDVVVNIPTEVSLEYIDQAREAARQDADAIATEFARAVAGASIATEWRREEPVVGAADDVWTRQALVADLVVVGQSASGADVPLTDTLIETGRPVLFVPYAGEYAHVGRQPLIAWNGTRESARAVFDALPLLKEASTVRVLCVDPDKAGAKAGLAPADDMALALARHGIKAEAARSHSGQVSVGDEILSQLADHGHDLLVMGCYGHSRLREMLFGGVTRHILQHMTAPVVMSR
ncbi:universal stress protein [Aurantimonas sp. A2-1-M11]|uniref:universal stress protein n=1 Tax=Aurantimonas sp. A2-1-M11 TaxID=3113712 RepID=UPI002F93B217